MKQYFSTKDNNIIAGDLNIAPYENDVWSHNQLKNVVSHTEIERTKLLDILKNGDFIDTFKIINTSFRKPFYLVELSFSGFQSK